QRAGRAGRARPGGVPVVAADLVVERAAGVAQPPVAERRVGEHGVAIARAAIAGAIERGPIAGRQLALEPEAPAAGGDRSAALDSTDAGPPHRFTRVHDPPVPPNITTFARLAATVKRSIPRRSRDVNARSPGRPRADGVGGRDRD